jgi:hypothetical protein
VVAVGEGGEVAEALERARPGGIGEERPSTWCCRPGARRVGSERSDGGIGVISSVAGLLVFLLFLLLAAQVLINLFATSTVRATLNDAAARAASTGRSGATADLAHLAAEAEASLGGMGDRTTIDLSYVDDDGDGLHDVVAGRAVAVPPGFIPRSIGGMFGFDVIDVSVRVRVERLR